MILPLLPTLLWKKWFQPIKRNAFPKEEILSRKRMSASDPVSTAADWHDPKVVADVKAWLEQLFPQNSEREFLMQYIASSVSRDTVEKKLHFRRLDDRPNTKGVLAGLYMAAMEPKKEPEEKKSS